MIALHDNQHVQGEREERRKAVHDPHDAQFRCVINGERTLENAGNGPLRGGEELWIELTCPGRTRTHRCHWI